MMARTNGTLLYDCYHATKATSACIGCVQQYRPPCTVVVISLRTLLCPLGLVAILRFCVQDETWMYRVDRVIKRPSFLALDDIHSLSVG